MKEYPNQWKDVPCLRIGRLGVIKVEIFHKLIYRFSAISIKIPSVFTAQMDKLILKLKWNCKGPCIVKTVFKKRNKVGRLTLPNFKTYHKTIVIKVVWYCNKDRHIEQWAIIEKSRNRPSHLLSVDC